MIPAAFSTLQFRQVEKFHEKVCKQNLCTSLQFAAHHAMCEKACEINKNVLYCRNMERIRSIYFHRHSPKYIHESY